jgi:Flp pilus assembly protein TadB
MTGTIPMPVAVAAGVVVIVVAVAVVLVVLIVTLSMRGRQKRRATRRAENRQELAEANERAARAERGRDIAEEHVQQPDGRDR